MKTLIVGTGVIGTLYGWALSEAGVDVTHLVRPGRKARLASGIALDVLDYRQGKNPRQVRTTYIPRMVEEVTPADGYELVIVATKHYQAEEAVLALRDHVGQAHFLMFNANWEGTQRFDAALGRERYLWGYPVGQGGFRDGVLIGSLYDDVRLGELDGGRTPRLEAIAELFRRAEIKPDLQDNILHWLWVHHAFNAGGIGSAIYVGGVEQLFGSLRNLRRAGLSIREALQVAAARGVDVWKYVDAKPFRAPSWLGAAMFRWIYLIDPGVRRSLKSGHFANNPDEMKQYYLDIEQTGRKMGMDLPHLYEMKAVIEAYKG